MSRLFVIHVKEDFYNDLHNAQSNFVVECENREEAAEIAEDCLVTDGNYEINEIIEETAESLERLNEKIMDDYPGFIKKYCNKDF